MNRRSFLLRLAALPAAWFALRTVVWKSSAVGYTEENPYVAWRRGVKFKPFRDRPAPYSPWPPGPASEPYRMHEWPKA